MGGIADFCSQRLYTLEKETFGRNAEDTDTERSVLIADRSDPDVVFKRALDNELQKIIKFYTEKEKELFHEVDVLVRDIEDWERDVEISEQTENPGGSGGSSRGQGQNIGDALATFRVPRRHFLPDQDDDSASDDDDRDNESNLTGLLRKVKRPSSTLGRYSLLEGRSQPEYRFSVRRRSSTTGLDDFQKMKRQTLFSLQLSLAKRCISVFVSLRELKSYIQLNRTGFSKALKKYDKILMKSLRQPYIENVVNQAYPFQENSIRNLDSKMAMVEHLYAKVATDGNVDNAKRELRLHLREHVVWERNTVWREMIGIERKAQAANMGLKRTLLGADPEPGDERLQGDDPYDRGEKIFHTPLGAVTCPGWLFSGNFFVLLGCLAIFVLLLTIPLMKNRVQQNCLAMLVFVSLLWATEVRLYYFVLEPSDTDYR